MKSDYYKLLNKYNLIDILNDVPEISYTHKINVLKKLIEKFEIKIVNEALNVYNNKYVKFKKYNLSYLYNTLFYLCKENKK